MREELRVLAARRGQRGPGLEAAAGPVQQQQVGVAVAAVHPRRPAGDVLGELRYGEEVAASHPDGLDGSRARGGNPLDLGEGHWHGITTATAIRARQVIWSYYRRHAALMDVTFHVLDVRKLIMLEAVMAEGSIAAAARRLQYTRSAVSQQMSALEAEAGTALIDRTGNRITLTPAGRALVEHAERILVELRSAEADAGRRRDADHRAAAGGHPVPRGPAHHEPRADRGTPAVPRHGDPARRDQRRGGPRRRSPGPARPGHRVALRQRAGGGQGGAARVDPRARPAPALRPARTTRWRALPAAR